MKPLCPKALIPSSSSCSPSSFFFLISQFSTSSNFSSYSSSSSFSSRRHEEDARNVKVSVWWDFENCHIPLGVNVFKVAQSITAAIRANGIKGSIQITAFGDMLQLSRSNQDALSATGINLTHIPRGGKNSADRSLLVDLMCWVSQNPPPAHLFLISGDRDFANILHRLRMNNYNILLASTESAPGVLCSAASIMWHWHALVRGEDLTGKHFNQPPDGPYGSWYGHYKGPLEDPFSVIEQPASTRTDELSEPGSETKPRPVPKAIMKLIRHILNTHPKGLYITELRSELSKSNVSIDDKNFYGHKKFSCFLSSMPHIVKLQSGGNGQFVIHGVTPKASEPLESNPCMSTGPVINNGGREVTASSNSSADKKSITDIPFRLCRDDKSITGDVNGKLPLPPFPELNIAEPSQNAQQPSSPSEKVVEVINTQVTSCYLPPKQKTQEVGVLKKFWKKWFANGDDGSEKKVYNLPEKCGTFADSSEKKSHSILENGASSVDSSRRTKVSEKCVESTSQDADTVHPESFSSSDNETTLDYKTTSLETYGDKSGSTPGFFKRIVKWCKSWRSETNSDSSSDQSNERMHRINSYSEKHELFSRESFWSEMESYMDTPKVLILVTQSRTREQMAQNLKKEGPLVLRSLSERYLLWLVDLLISEKKWVEECQSQTSPFKLTRPVGKCSLAHSRGSKELRSIFSGEQSQCNLLRIPEPDGELQYQNIPHTGVSSSVIHKKPSSRPRNEILADCQTLVNETLKEFPEGFNMASFRKLFLERYGYSLDLQRLGYQKLASLMEIMPGIELEGTRIIPSGKVLKSSNLGADIPDNNVSCPGANSDSELSDASKKNDDSPWEELGPVADATSDRSELKLGLTWKEKEEARQTPPDYESSLSDDDFSDSEGENSSVNRSGGLQKTGINEEDSSLLQILDSWYSSKEGDNGKKESKNIDGMIDCSRNNLKPSDSSVEIKSETCVGYYERKQKPQKSYTFVTDPVGIRKDNLVDGILCSLKKSGESRMEG